MIGFAQIIGGKPSSVGGMTDHLMNKTLALSPEDERLALYYGRGQVRNDPLRNSRMKRHALPRKENRMPRHDVRLSR